MKPFYQIILGLLLLSCVVFIGILGYTDIYNQLPILSLRLVQYVIAVVSGILLGDAIKRL